MDQWDQFVLEHPDSIAWQLSSWSSIVEKNYGCRFFPIAALDSTGIVGVLPLYQAKTFPGKNRLISVAHAVAGGILASDQEVRDSLLQRAVSLNQELGGSGLTLKQYKIRMPGSFKVDDNYYNRELSLEGGGAAVMERISEGNREIVDRVSSEDFVLEHPSTDRKGFYRFLLRHHRRRGVPCAGKGWIRDLEVLGMYSIAVLKKNGRIVAGTMVKEYRDTISFPFTCAAGDDPAGQYPVYRLYWDLINSYSDKGFGICHSGRIPVTDEVDAYRLGWGGTRFPYFYQYFPDTGGSTEFSQKRNRKRELIETVWKRLPLSVASRLGPYVVRQFP
jgi:hypothetical protein